MSKDKKKVHIPRVSAPVNNPLNAEMNDFNEEWLLMMAAAAYQIYGAQIIISKCERDCNLFGLKDTFFQQKKQYIGNAAKAMDNLSKNLVAGFDGWFEKINTTAERLQYVHQYANDMAKLAILFVSRCDHSADPRNEVFKFIRSLPEGEDNGDVEKVLEYFNRRF